MANKIRSIQRAQEQAEAKAETITVTLADLLASQQALQSLAQQPLPARLAFKLSKVLKAVTKELDTCNETRIKLCDQYGTKREDGSYKFSKANEELVNKEYNDLVQTQVTIRGEHIDLEDLPGLTISAADVIRLAWLME